MEFDCYLRNVQDLPADGKTPYERRFGEPIKGPVIPFGAMVECHPIAARDQSGLHQLGKQGLPGIFFRHAFFAGEFGEGIFWLQTLKSWEIWTRQKSMLEGSTQKKC